MELYYDLNKKKFRLTKKRRGFNYIANKKVKLLALINERELGNYQLYYYINEKCIM